MPKFDKPLNKWIEEEVEIPVMKPKINKAKGRIEFTQSKQKATQKTYYANSPQKRVVCDDHFFVLINPGKYIFKCKNCDWHKIAYPVTYRYNPETGKLTHRKTGVQL